jgi:hypothetical protein
MARHDGARPGIVGQVPDLPSVSFLTKSNVGRSPWTAVDALVGLRLTGLARPDLGVRRGRGRPPHIQRYKNFIASQRSVLCRPGQE